MKFFHKNGSKPKKKHIQTFSSLLATAVISSCAPTPPESKLQMIQAHQNDDSKSVVRLLGYSSTSGKREYYLGISNNIHVVQGCESKADLLKKIDLDDENDVKNVALNALLTTEKNYRLRSTLSCGSSFPVVDHLENKQVSQDFFVDREHTYISTGVQKEYYRLQNNDSACAFNLTESSLFNLERRLEFRVLGAPSELADSTIIDLSCLNSPKRPYILTKIEMNAGIFNDILVLSYIKDDKKIDIPIYKINGQFIADSDVRDDLISELKEHYNIEDIVTDSEGIAPYFGKVLYDYCYKCEKDFDPSHGIFSISSSSSIVPLDKTVKVLKKKHYIDGTSISSFKISDQEEVYFRSCDDDLLSALHLSPVSAPGKKFSDIKRNLVRDKVNSIEAFTCPSATLQQACSKVLTKNSYSNQEIWNILSEKPDHCNNQDSLVLKLDADVTLQSDSVIDFSFSMPFKNVTIEPLVSSDKRKMTFEFQCGSDCDERKKVTAFKSYKKDLLIKNIDIIVSAVRTNKTTNDESPEPLPPIQKAFLLRGGKLTLNNSTISSDKKVDLMKAIVFKNDYGGEAYCIDCNLSSIGPSIEGKDILVGVKGKYNKNAKDTSLNISSKETGLHLIGRSNLVMSNAQLVANKVLHLGGHSEAFIYKSNLKLDSSLRSESDEFSAFSLSTRKFAGVYTMEMWESKVSGLPKDGVSRFNFVDFDLGDGTAIIDIKNTKFYRGDNKELNEFSRFLLLTCKGHGTLRYKNYNYCHQ